MFTALVIVGVVYCPKRSCVVANEFVRTSRMDLLSRYDHATGQAIFEPVELGYILFRNMASVLRIFYCGRV